MFRKSMMMSGVLVAALALAACSGGGADAGGDAPASGETIKIGAALPMTGALASFGPLIEQGYQRLVDDVNEAGGIEIDGAARQVELIVRDSESDSTKSAEATRALVLDDEVSALLGSVTPPLQVPASTVADAEGVPLVGSFTPVQSWLAGNPEGWSYAWNFFFDEDDMTALQYKVADLTETNKKVALFTDNAEDGTMMGALWEQKAPEYGYEIAYRATFPVGTADYTSYINELKASGAEVLISIMIPPDAMALWKQLKAADVDLQLAFAEKAGSSVIWPDGLGEIAEGTVATDYFLPSDDALGAELKAMWAETVGDNVEASGSVLAYSAAKVLTDAIARAGSLDPSAINEEIANTSGMYPSGYEIEFGDDHASRIEPVSSQWVGPDTKQIFPQVEGISLVVPIAGLQ
jgi:branched-chain amino acid transport system substrate-binding protein